MQVPVFGYRSLTGIPIAYATVDIEIVTAMESFAGERLVLTFGKWGQVLVHTKYIEYLLDNYRNGSRKQSALLNYVTGRMPFRPVTGKVKFLDGNIMNFLQDNLEIISRQ